MGNSLCQHNFRGRSIELPGLDEVFSGAAWAAPPGGLLGIVTRVRPPALLGLGIGLSGGLAVADGGVIVAPDTLDGSRRLGRSLWAQCDAAASKSGLATAGLRRSLVAMSAASVSHWALTAPALALPAALPDLQGRWGIAQPVSRHGPRQLGQPEQLVIAGGRRPFDQPRLGGGNRRGKITRGLGRMWLADLHGRRLGFIGRHQLPQACRIERARLVSFDDSQVLISVCGLSSEKSRGRST